MTLKLKPAKGLGRTAGTWLVLIVDRSGSMMPIKQDMEGGIKRLFEDQAKLPGKCFVTMVQFDTEYELLANVLNIESIDSYELIPRGGTALLDAIGRTVVAVGEAQQATAYKPSEVIVAIITDGEENSSREWDIGKVKALIETKTAEGWHFTYLGANQDAITVARDMGIARMSSINFAADSGGVEAAYAGMSSVIGQTRTTGLAPEYDESQREAAKPGGSGGSVGGSTIGSHGTGH
jgi:uncharacterized protein YegL